MEKKVLVESDGPASGLSHPAQVNIFFLSFFLSKCPFHSQNPERTMMGNKTHLTIAAAGGIDATGP